MAKGATATLLVVCAVVLALPAAAAAQLPPGLPPILPPPGAGGGVGAPPGQALAYSADPSRDGRSAETTVFGPLYRAWSHRVSGLPDQPLIVGDTIVASVGGYGSEPSLVALDARNGHQRWGRAIPGSTGAAPIAATADRVIAVGGTPDGIAVSAYTLADGSQLWSRVLDFESSAGPPVADGGSVYFMSTEALYALSVADGDTEWSETLPFDGSYGTVSVDSQRVYAADGCGNAIAYQRGGGLFPAWDRSGDCDEIRGGTTSVYDGRLYGPLGRTYDAATGADVITYSSGKPQAFAGSLGYDAYSRSLAGINLAGGQFEWSLPIGSVPVPALVVGPTIYTADESGIQGAGATTGERLSRTKTRSGEQGALWPGIAAGAGKLVVPGPSHLRGYAPVLTPKPRDISIAASGFDLVAGKKIYIVGGVGSELRPQRPPIVLVANPADGHTGRVRTDPSNEDGTAYYRDRIGSNTRYTVLVPAGNARAKPVAKDSFTAFAYAKIRLTQARYVSLDSIVVKGKVTKIDPRRLAGARMVTYYGARHARRFKRLGTSKLHRAGKHEVRSSFRFHVPKGFGRHELLTICVKNLPQLGWGRNTGVLRECGKRTLHVRRGKAPQGERGAWSSRELP